MRLPDVYLFKTEQGSTGEPVYVMQLATFLARKTIPSLNGTVEMAENELEDWINLCDNRGLLLRLMC